MRLSKERPTERKVKESWGFSGNRKEEKNSGKKREKKERVQGGERELCPGNQRPTLKEEW